jgi:hypothetical protein
MNSNVKLHPDLKALAELISSELTFGHLAIAAPNGPVVDVFIAENLSVRLFHCMGKIWASDLIPGVPMTQAGNGYLRYQVTI